MLVKENKKQREALMQLLFVLESKKMDLEEDIKTAEVLHGQRDLELDNAEG